MARLLKMSGGRITAAVAPENGGMLTSLCIDGCEVLHTDPEFLEICPIIAGGIPILFPYPSKTADDAYTVHGKTYAMPLHGLVKNDVFAVRAAAEDRIVLTSEPAPVWLSECYPFPYRLTVEYRLTDTGICMDTAVTNTGAEPLSHGLGLHPYFRVTDSKTTRLTQFNTVHYDYGSCEDLAPLPQNPDLTQEWDNVLHTPTEHRFVLENPADGYRVDCFFDDAFRALVLCNNAAPDSVCVEPWCVLPNAANTGRFVQTVAPGETRHYRLRLELSTLRGSAL